MKFEGDDALKSRIVLLTEIQAISFFTIQKSHLIGGVWLFLILKKSRSD